ELALGPRHSCARTMDGAVWCWGAGGRGQLGWGSVVGRNVPVKVLLTSPASAIAAGDEHTCAVTAMSGRVFCWGADTWGQLGDGATADQPAPVQANAPGTAAGVAAGRDHTCVTGTDGA